MKILITTLLTGLAIATATQAAEKTNADGGKMRIGIYESRSIVAAYANTPLHKGEMKPLMDAYAKAKASGDTNKIKECEAAGKAVQRRVHRQAFSTAPVDDILEKIPTQVAQIKTHAQVTALVSKWDAATLDKYPKAERVDLTKELVAALNPDERQQKNALRAKDHKPIPLDKIDKELDNENESPKH
jgi:hypothetical protein